MRSGLLFAVLSVVSLTACGTGYVPPRLAVVPREATPVSASYDTTWATVVSYFADRNVAIRTIEKASGIIVAEALRADMQNREPIKDKKGKVVHYLGSLPQLGPPIFADCGSSEGYPLDLLAASFNVRVLGDKNRSTVRVTARFTTAYGTGVGRQVVDCVSTGKFEMDLEARVKKVADTR